MQWLLRPHILPTLWPDDTALIRLVSLSQYHRNIFFRIEVRVFGYCRKHYYSKRDIPGIRASIAASVQRGIRLTIFVVGAYLQSMSLRTILFITIKYINEPKNRPLCPQTTTTTWLHDVAPPPDKPVHLVIFRNPKTRDNIFFSWPITDNHQEIFHENKMPNLCSGHILIFLLFLTDPQPHHCNTISPYQVHQL